MEEHGAPLKTQMQIDVCVEEIFVNIAYYAYAPDTGEAVVSVELSENPDAVSITFRDTGKPFDPLKHDDPDVTLEAESCKIGGLGILMTKNMMDEVTYEYRDGQNILKIKTVLQ